jgi:hypothetical protein
MDTKKISIISYFVSALALAIIVLTLYNLTFPFLTDYKIAFIVLWIIGLIMSILAGTRDTPGGKSTLNKNVMIILAIFGVATIPLLAVVVLDISFLTLRDLFIALSVIIISKWLITHLYNLTKK